MVVCGGTSVGYMIQCAQCETWLHVVCMSLRKDMINEDSIFRCQWCASISHRFGFQGPELEQPAIWSIKTHRDEEEGILIIPIEYGVSGVIDGSIII